MTALRDDAPGRRVAGAYGAAGFVYLVTFGPSVVNAILVASTGMTGSTQDTPALVLSRVAQLLGWGVATIALAVLVARSRGADAAALGLRPPRTARAWRRDVDIAAAAVLAIAVGSYAAKAIAASTGYAGHVHGSVGVLVVSTALAGPTEELAVLAVPYVLLRRAGEPSWRIVPLLLGARIAYHVYYGWPALGLGVWALATLVIFAVGRRVLPIMLAHSVWDLAVIAAALRGTPGLPLLVLGGGAVLWGTARVLPWLVTGDGRSPLRASRDEPSEQELRHAAP